MIGFAGRAEVLSAETLFSIRKAGRRTEGSSSFILRRWLSLARLLFHTKTESIQLPDGEIDTETLSPVSLYNCINSFLPASLLISPLFTSPALAGDASSPFLSPIVSSNNLGLVCSPTRPVALPHFLGPSEGLG